MPYFAAKSHFKEIGSLESVLKMQPVKGKPCVILIAFTSLWNARRQVDVSFSMVFSDRNMAFGMSSHLSALCIITAMEIYEADRMKSFPAEQYFANDYQS